MEFTVQEHFLGKSQQVADMYAHLIDKLKAFGPLKIEPRKTSIHLGNRYGFAGVYTRKDYINLEFHLDRKIADTRIAKVEQASPNRFHHTVRLADKAEIDDTLMSWLHAAYELKK